jgi:hypothetical protein
MMKKLLFALLLLPVMATASPLTITFNKLLLVTRNSPYGGCETSTQGYTFDVTMLGWNLSPSSCTATNLFPTKIINTDNYYLTTGQRAPRGAGQMWMTPTISGTTFSLLGFTIKNYGLSTNTLYLDTTTTEGAVITTVIAPSTTSVTFDPAAPGFSGVTKLSIRSTNNRFDITNINIR